MFRTTFLRPQVSGKTLYMVHEKNILPLSLNIRNNREKGKILNDKFPEKLSLFFALQRLNINSFFLLLPLDNRWLFKCLTATKFPHYTCLLEFSFELLQSSFNVFTFFDRYNYHNYVIIKFLYANILLIRYLPQKFRLQIK